MQKNIYLAVGCALFFAHMVYAYEVRTWTAAVGQYTVEASMFAIFPDSVILEGKNGGQVDIMLDKLSKEDREYIQRVRLECQKPSNNQGFNPSQEVRTWTSADKKSKVEAEFVTRSTDEKFVFLNQKADGKEIEVIVIFERLAKEDQEYVKQQQKIAAEHIALKVVEVAFLTIVEDRVILTGKQGGQVEILLENLSREDREYIQQVQSECMKPLNTHGVKPLPEAVRTWTSVDGRSKVEAEFVARSTNDRYVILKIKTNGKEVESIAIFNRLAQEDQEYVKQRQKITAEHIARKVEETKEQREQAVKERAERLSSLFAKKMAATGILTEQEKVAAKERQREVREAKAEQRKQAAEQRIQATLDMLEAIMLMDLARNQARVGNRTTSTSTPLPPVNKPAATSTPTPSSNRTERQPVRCSTCNGTGTRTDQCGSCSGRGHSTFSCSLCKGTGKSGLYMCRVCNGLGFPVCDRCKGVKTEMKSCPSCSGRGTR